MEFEVLHRSKRKQFIIAGCFVVLILVAIVIGVTFAKYRVTKSIELASGTVNYTRADLNLVGVYLEKKDEVGQYDSSEDVPTSGYTLNTEKSYCTGSEGVSITYTDGKLNFSGLSKRGTKCYAYFDVIRDTQVPTISNVTSSVTKTSITVNVTASDNEGVTKYFYSINNGAYTETTSSSHTFNSLTAGTSYSIKIKVQDAAGNESTEWTGSIKTESDGNTMSTILAGYSKSTRSNFGSAFTTSTTKQVYTTTDWEGTSYYFAGAPTDNWVRWAGYYWRIIRVNGDGTIRLIYNGTGTSTTGSGTLADTSEAFNSEYDRSEYVGLKYTKGEQYGQNTDSTILDRLQSWYTSSGLSSYADDIDTNVGFCSDRNMASGYSWSSQPSSTIRYAAYARIAQNYSPSLSCSTSDIIKEPVGLITADEAMFAGVPWSGNATGNYLINGQNYWTMSPYYFVGSAARVFRVNSSGYLNGNSVNGTYGVRPVINLKADTKFEGSGKSDDPFVVVN